MDETKVRAAAKVANELASNASVAAYQSQVWAQVFNALMSEPFDHQNRAAKEDDSESETT